MGPSILQNLSGQLISCSGVTKKKKGEKIHWLHQTFNLMEASLFGSNVHGEDTLRSELGEGKGGSNQSWAPPRPQEGKGRRAESRQEREHADRSHVT